MRDQRSPRPLTPCLKREVSTTRDPGPEAGEQKSSHSQKYSLSKSALIVIRYAPLRDYLQDYYSESYVRSKVQGLPSSRRLGPRPAFFFFFFFPVLALGL